MPATWETQVEDHVLRPTSTKPPDPIKKIKEKELGTWLHSKLKALSSKPWCCPPLQNG
jgi:hypothetical protein